MRRRLAAAILLSCAAPSAAHAYRTAADLPDFADGEPVRWTGEVSLQLYDRPLTGIGPADLSDAIRRAAGTWNDVACSALTVLPPRLSTEHASSEDGRVTIEALGSEWTARGFSADAAATTDVIYAMDGDGTWRIVDADVYVNDTGFDWTVTPTPAADGARDVEAVLTHELGHAAAGLLHPCEPGGADGAPACETDPRFMEASLFPIYLGTSQRELGADDIAGVCWLAPMPSECGTCEPGTACVDGACGPLCGPTACAATEECVDRTCVARCTGSGCATQPCDADADCPEPLACRSGACAIGLGSIGDPCDTARECESGLCSAGGACASACSDDGRCPDGFACDAETASCTPEAGVFGDACAAGGECISGLCATYRTRPDPGYCTRECTDARPCPAAFVCDEVDGVAVCRTPPAGGCAASRGRAPSWPSATLLALIGLSVLRRRR